MSIFSKIVQQNGNVLDLIWSNIFTDASINTEYHSTYDQHTITGSVFLQSETHRPKTHRFRHVNDADLEEFASSVRR